jgi:hypothetical protein
MQTPKSQCSASRACDAEPARSDDANALELQESWFDPVAPSFCEYRLELASLDLPFFPYHSDLIFIYFPPLSWQLL